MVDAVFTWAVRSVHVFGAAIWLGGFAMMLLVIVPFLARERHAPLRGLAEAAARLISGAGALTIVAGLVLIWRSRGYGFLIVGGLALLMMTRAIYART